MREKGLIRGNEYLYFPYITDINELNIKLYYCFSREIKNQNGLKSKQYIFAKDKKTLNRFKSIKSYENAIKKNILTGFSDFVIDDNPIYFKKYSDKLNKRINNFYEYICEVDENYKKAKAFSKFYSNGKETLYYSIFFSYLRKHYLFYKFKINFVILFYYFVGIIKIPIYPFIFIKDILKSSIKTYNDYKLKESSAKYYNNPDSMTKILYYHDQKKFETEKKNANNELQKVEKNYINSNISLFTLLIALITLVFTIVVNTKNNIKTQADLRESDRVINELQNENNLLKNKVDSMNMKLENDALFKQIIDLNNSVKIIIDDNTLRINSLEENEKELEQKIKDKK